MSDLKRLRFKQLHIALIAAALAILCAGGIDVAAHKGAKGVVKKRMDVMKSIGDNMKAMKKMFGGETPYDAKKVKQGAVFIKNHAGKSLTKLFPKGSLQKPTEATNRIWEEWAGFEANAMRLQAYAGALEVAARQPSDAAQAAGSNVTMSTADVAEGGWPAVEDLERMPPQAVFMAVAKTCKYCHESYRQKKNHEH